MCLFPSRDCTGQISAAEDLNTATPSVLIEHEMFADERKPPGCECFVYCSPSYISVMQSSLLT